ncbi:MAG: hypothetical protein KAJ81_09745 [Candidatus Latescibacteria bacterium]|nr:hypothetical protein [Candidatus Latescibacterota bacterium]
MTVAQYFQEIIHALILSPSISHYRVLSQRISDEEGYLRVRGTLTNGDMIEGYEYTERFQNRIEVVAYSFHQQTQKGQLVRRWDNTTHHKEVRTFPHHLHRADGCVVESIPMDFNRFLSALEEITPSS